MTVLPKICVPDALPEFAVIVYEPPDVISGIVANIQLHEVLGINVNVPSAVVILTGVPALPELPPP